MRSLLLNLALLSLLLIPALAQQPDSPQSQPKTETQAKTNAASKKAQSAPAKSPETPTATEEQKPEAAKESGDKAKDKEEHFDMTEVAPIVTHHQITVNGKLLHYTATAGRLPIKRDDGKIEAEMFFVAYTLDGQETSKRPLTFAFNGGPGSSSIWLHMGALGPKKVVLQPDGFMPPAPTAWKTILTRCSTKPIWCWWTRLAQGSVARAIPSCSRSSGELRATLRPSVNSFVSTSRVMSAGLHLSTCWVKAMARRGRRESRATLPTMAFPSMELRCFRWC